MIRWYGRMLHLLIVAIILIGCTPRKETETVSAPPEATAAPIAAVTASEATPNTPSAPPPTSTELINTALDKGDIDATTALKYKVFAQYSDSRLPTNLKGTALLNTDSHILDELQAQIASLPNETQLELLPFLAPPIYKGSWADLAAGGEPVVIPRAPGGDTDPFQYSPPCNEIDNEHWEFKTAMHSPVRFWWHKDFPESEDAVNRFITAMDDDIWPKLTGLMGRTPLPDGGVVCNGGNPDLDVYVTPMVERSSAPSMFPPGCKETPAYILINPGETDAILAHEFFHDIQWGVNTSAGCMYPGNYAWLAEATASWSQNYVYPNDNAEHGYVDWFFNGGSPPTLELKNDSHEYGAHLFFFYLTNKFGRPDIVKTVWDYTTSLQSLEALDKAIPGGIKDVWGEFAVENMDEPPYDDYQVWDQMNIKPAGGSLTKGQVSPNKWDVTKEIDYLSIQYQWFTFSQDSRLVTFFNGLTYKLDDEPINTMMGALPINDGTTQYKFTPAQDVDSVKIQAYFKVAGDTDWQLEDWTDKPYVSFCRDAQDENLTDLVIITSNSSMDAKVSAAGTYNPTLQVSDVGCYRYGGNASLLFTGAGEGGSFTDEQSIPNVAFERTDVHPNIPYPILHFKVAEGNVDRTYNYQGTDNGCTGSGNSNDPLGAAPAAMFGNDLFILSGAVTGDSVNRYSGQANANQSIEATFTCPDGTTTQSILSQPWFYIDMLSQVPERKYIVSSGGVLEGSDDMLQGVNSAAMSYEWHFEPLAETGSEGSSASGSSGSGSSGSGGAGGSSGSPGSPSTATIGDVPPYPNADTAQVTGGMLMITTPDTRENVVKFYIDALTSQGWKLMTDPNTSSNNMTQLVFSKDSKLTTIMVSSTDAKTMVVINQTGK